VHNKLEQVVKVIRQKTALPPQTDGSIVFARWRECALPYEHTGATWRIQLNSCFIRPTRIHNPNGNSISSAVFAQLTAQCRRVHWRHLANTIEIVHIGAKWRIRLNLCFLQSTQVHNPNGNSIGSAIFAQLTANTLPWAPFPKIAPFRGGIWTAI